MSAQVTAVQSFTEFKLNGLGNLLIPDSMELQSGAYKRLSGGFSKDLGYDVSGEVIFQQKGLNDFNFGQVSTYARVMIVTEIETLGSYRKLSSKIRMSARELQATGDALRKQLAREFQSLDIRMLKWDGVSVVSVNGQNAIKVTYLRQLKENPPVHVEIYTFENNDRVHRLTISYRQEDAKIWKDALGRTLNSFRITNIR